MLPAIPMIISALGGLGGLVSSAGEVVKTVSGDQTKRDEQDTQDKGSARTAYAAEWSAPARTNWFDRLIDGVNRLVRPLMTFGTIALFFWAGVDPVSFSASMVGITLVPEPLWLILGSIVAFWFGGRLVDQIRAPKMDAAATKAVLSTISEIQALKQPPAAPEVATAGVARLEQSTRGAERAAVAAGAVGEIGDEWFLAEMAGDEPLSLPAIAEWNRRRQAAGSEQ